HVHGLDFPLLLYLPNPVSHHQCNLVGYVGGGGHESLVHFVDVAGGHARNGMAKQCFYGRDREAEVIGDARETVAHAMQSDAVLGLDIAPDLWQALIEPVVPDRREHVGRPPAGPLYSAAERVERSLADWADT